MRRQHVPNIFDRKARLEMGRKLLLVSGSSPGSLRIGVTAASFSVSGTEPELKDELMITVMSGEIGGRQSLTDWMGWGPGYRWRFSFILLVERWRGCK